MGGKPRKTRASKTCVCGHHETLHKEGQRCGHYSKWESPDGTEISETFCICTRFLSDDIHVATEQYRIEL